MQSRAESLSRRYSRQMDAIAFPVERGYVLAVVNGVDLRDIASRPGLMGFDPKLLPPSGELFGEAEQRNASRYLEPWAPSVPILVCGCGEAGCGAVTIRVSGAQGEIVWSDISDYSPENGEVDVRVGPFRFNRADYSKAVGSAVRALHSRYPIGMTGRRNSRSARDAR